MSLFVLTSPVTNKSPPEADSLPIYVFAPPLALVKVPPTLTEPVPFLIIETSPFAIEVPEVFKLPSPVCFKTYLPFATVVPFTSKLPLAAIVILPLLLAKLNSSEAKFAFPLFTSLLNNVVALFLALVAEEALAISFCATIAFVFLSRIPLAIFAVSFILTVPPFKSRDSRVKIMPLIVIAPLP